MDSVTQIVLGATIGEAGFRKKLGPKAPIVGGICGLLPDLDLFFSSDTFERMVTHRGSSHSLLVLPLVALPVGWLAWRWAKKRGALWTWVHLCFWGLITHPLLDVFTAYGTQLFAPFDRTRFALDGASIIDPIYTLPLMVACVFAARSNRQRAQKFARFALLVTSLYLAFGTLNAYIVRARAYPYYPAAAHIRATPTFFNCLVFRIVVTEENGDIHTALANAWRPRALSFRHHPQARHPDVDVLLATERGKVLRWFSGPSLQAELAGEGEHPRIRFWDRKYGLFRSDISPFAYEGEVHADGTTELERLSGMRDNLDVSSELGGLWEMLTHGTLTNE